LPLFLLAFSLGDRRGPCGGERDAGQELQRRAGSARSVCAFGVLCGIQIPVKERRCIDDLPAVRIPRLRAEGGIDESTTEFVVKLGAVEQTVGVALQRFGNGGSWSLFRCPTCARLARVLRLLNGRVLCWRCCVIRGVRYRAEPMSRRQRAEHSILRLKGVLESPVSLRLKPVLWGTMERRSRYEAALHEAEFRAAQRGRPRKAAAISDPCDEPGFQPPKPRPLKPSKSR
jgi:hypothetical protein